MNSLNSINEPLMFAPVHKSYLWGGDKIARYFRREKTPEICAESWEISALPDGMSVVTEGAFKGSSLDALVKRFGTELTGTRAPQSDRFPLLFKIIDARRKLSVQVHPNNANAHLTNGKPKTEMWYVLDCEEGSTLYAGMVATATKQSVEEAINKGTVADQLIKLSVHPGQALFIPGGLVHAIGEGCLIYEVQQSSNTTFRLFDWNRTNAEGHPRQLHIKESLATIDWDLKPPTMVSSEPEASGNGARLSNLVSCDFFKVKNLELTSQTEIMHSGESFTALFMSSGSASLKCGEITLNLQHGASALIPAAVKSCTIETVEPSSILVTTL